ncbi:hypothetical protein GCM10023228_01730 [Brevibacillus fulvus]
MGVFSMILDLSDLTDLRQKVSYGVSPLFELATSLYVLAQPARHEPHAGWVANSLQILRKERLLAEWHYLFPLFQQSVPALFYPQLTERAMSVDEQYDYLVNIDTGSFLASLPSELLQPTLSVPISSLPTDIQSDPEAVKCRLILFLSSYWQLLFQRKWERLAPRFLQEAEAIEQALGDIEQLTQLLRTILPVFRDEHCLCFADKTEPERRRSLHKLTLYPSLFFTHAPQLTACQETLLLLYNCEQRTQPLG